METVLPKTKYSVAIKYRRKTGEDSTNREVRSLGARVPEEIPEAIEITSSMKYVQTPHLFPGCVGPPCQCLLKESKEGFVFHRPKTCLETFPHRRRVTTSWQ